MPPKRKAASAPSEPKARQSKLAKENNISASEESEILEAYNLFCITNPDVSTPKGKGKAKATSTSSTVLPTREVRRALIALGLKPSPGEMKDFLEILDPDEEGHTSYEQFLAVAALKMRAKDGEEDQEGREKEVEEGFRLFTDGERITINDLKRVAMVLKEDVDEQLLKDMILEANGGGGLREGVDVGAFKEVMGRAGVFRT